MLAELVEEIKRKIQTVIAPKPENPDDPDAPFALVGAPLKPRPPLRGSLVDRCATRTVTAALIKSFRETSRGVALANPPRSPPSQRLRFDLFRHALPSESTTFRWTFLKCSLRL